MRDINIEDYDLSVRIREENDIVVARQMVKNMVRKMGFTLSDVTKISTAVSELARNIYRYAGEGYILLREKQEKDGKNVEVEIVAYDRGPGIEDLDSALKDGYTTTRNSFGLGLPGVRRLMDSFHIESEKGSGTIVIVSKKRRAF